MNRMIALVGEQPLPNLLPAIHLKPDEILLLYSGFTESACNRLSYLLDEKNIKVNRLKCQNEYDAVSISSQIKNEFDRLGWKDSAHFNLTGGTKAMVLAAYEHARRLNSEVMYLESGSGKNRLFRYQFRRDELQPIGEPEELPELITIEQYLNAHLGQGNWKECGYSKDIGGVFEEAVGEALKPVIEIMPGVKFLGDEQGRRPQADLDLVVRVKNQIGVVEIKNQNKASLDALKQLHYLSRLLGTYTKKFWILSREPSEDHQAVIEVTRTTVIPLNFNDSRLSEADVEKLQQNVLASFRP